MEIQRTPTQAPQSAEQSSARRYPSPQVGGKCYDDLTKLPEPPAMTVYIVAELKFTDRAAYDRYQARFLPVFKRFNGRLLAADENPQVLEGAWPRQKIVMMSFPDEAEARRFADDAEYQEISKDRKAGADAVVLLVHGLS